MVLLEEVYGMIFKRDRYIILGRIPITLIYVSISDGVFCGYLVYNHSIRKSIDEYIGNRTYSITYTSVVLYFEREADIYLESYDTNISFWSSRWNGQLGLTAYHLGYIRIGSIVGPLW